MKVIPSKKQFLEYQNTESKRSNSPSEAKFRLAEKLFTPNSQGNKSWYSKDYVDELQKFYQNERESLKDRIDRIYKESDDSKIRLLGQIDELKAQLKSVIDKHKEENIALNTDHSQKIAMVMREKDGVITETKNQVYELRNELSQMTLKYSDLLEDSKRKKIEFESQIDNLSQQLKNQIEIFDSTRNDYEYRLKALRERNEVDKEEIRKDNLVSK